MVFSFSNQSFIPQNIPECRFSLVPLYSKTMSRIVGKGQCACLGLRSSGRHSGAAARCATRDVEVRRVGSRPSRAWHGASVRSGWRWSRVPCVRRKGELFTFLKIDAGEGHKTTRKTPPTTDESCKLTSNCTREVRYGMNR